jgi:predicted PurR-regulated permease PerM
MIVIKVLAPIATFIIGILQVLLERKWHDKRTRKHRVVVTVLYGAMIVAAVFAVLAIIDDERQMQELLENGRTISRLLKPFADKAERQYPDQGMEIALHSLAVDLELLRYRAQKLVPC